MRRSLAWLLFVTVTGCGGDDAPSDTGEGSTSTTDTSSTGPTSSTSTTDPTTTSSSSTSTGGTSEGSTDGSTGSTTGSEGEACLPEGVLAALDQHLHDLVASAGLTSGHPGDNEAIGFLLAPGLPEPPAVVAQFAGPFIMVCSDALLYDPYCADGQCTRLECTGDGAGWVNHVWLESPFTDGEWNNEEIVIDIAWADGATGVTFTLTTMATGPDGVDASMSAEGTMDVEVFTITETFAALHPAGDAVLTFENDTTYTGTLTIAGTVVAEADEDGHLQPTGECP